MSLIKLELRMSIIFMLFLILGLSSFTSASILGTNELHQPRLSTSRALLQHQKRNYILPIYSLPHNHLLFTFD
ncbi:hypothetical protein KSS87_019016 [Heliosperma pusillum]|nr:hypothetical protein KSS87_019016 [Heliosperma pusillum]